MSSPALIDSMTLAFWSPGPYEMLLLAAVALLLFGGNLPEVARSWGKSFAEFRRGLSGFQNELNDVIYSEPDQIAYHEDPVRDDSRYADGYEDADDDYQVDSAALDEPETIAEPAEPAEPAEIDEIDESDQTVRDAGTDTVIEDFNTEGDNEKRPND
ncbi:MAG: Sec-independent protein translocase subunit TatA/TatB [Bythopirellula sp.]